MKCYAAELGNCSKKISREHFISKSVLEIAGKGIQISGFPWQETNKPMIVGINSLASNILCEAHNSQLSPIDNTAYLLISSIKHIFNQALSDEEFSNEEFCISGIEFELWLLKILCGILAINGKYKIPDKWIELLFKRQSFPDKFGLYIFGQPREASWFFNLVRFISVLDKKGNIAGAKLGIGGIAFLLSFGTPIFEEEGMQSIYRPNSIEIKKDMNVKKISFFWPEGVVSGSVLLNITGKIQNSTNPEFRPIVLPDKNV